MPPCAISASCGAALDDLSLVHHEDLRGMADGFQPVGDHIVTEYYRTLLVQNNFLPAPAQRNSVRQDSAGRLRRCRLRVQCRRSFYILPL